MKGLFGRNYTVVLKLLLMMLLASTSTVSAISLPIYVGPFPNDDFKFGQVMARAIVIDPETGQPILVRFNEDGSEAGVVNTGNELASEVGVFSADDYRFFELQLDAYNTQFEQTLANGAELLSREEYESRDFKASDNQTAVVKPVLPEGVNSVYIRAQVRRLPRPESQQSEPDESLILLRFPFDLSQEVEVADASVSIVVNKEGQIIEQSDKRIGYRNGFFGNPNEAQNERDYQVQEDDEVFGPIKFAFVSVDPFAYRGGADTSDKDGKYSFRFYMPLCPIGGFTFTTDVTAQLRYKNNLPTGSPSIPYFVRTPGYSYCFAQLAPAFLAPTLLAIQATSTSFRRQSNLIVDVTFLTGRLAIKNRDGEPVPIGETTYTEFEEEAEDTLQRHYDFNRDGQEDTVIQGKIEQRTDPETNEEFSVFVPGDGDEFDKQGIFFDGSQDDELDFPDLVRVLDQELRSDEEVGILKSISVADVRNTDILVFRDATGQLIMERRGLKEEEPDSEERQAIQYDPDANETGYRVMLRGRYDTALNSGGTNFRRGSYEDWATKNQLTEPFQTRVSDQPRPGEIVTVVAINRATGYMGTAKTKLQISNVFTQGAIDGQRDAADISVRVPKITLQPPNLKIWAEREYNVEKGITQDEERKYLIGSEGASLVSDTLIRVYTEWLDENGYPLPRELGLDEGEEYGLTGRLAKVAGQNTLTGVNGSSDLAEFAIKPGRETQVIRTADNLKQAEHFYIHVIGKSKDQECVNQTSCPSFSQTGEGLYAGRPQLLTPFKVPLFDENTTWLEYRSYRDVLDQFNEENTQITDKPEKPLPSYVWQYRPEYQFSQYDLEVQEINREIAGEDPNDPEIIDILHLENPTISSSDDLVNILYSLVSSQFDRLDPIDGEQELVLALGEEEQIVTIGEDQTISFENLEALGLLDSEDLLTIRLYANNDAGNILWEYAFGSDLEGQSDIRVVSADDREIDLFAYFPISIDKNSPKNIKVLWEVTEGGQLTNTITDSPDGVFRNTLTASTTAGTTHKITARVIDSDDERVVVGTFQEFGPFTVAPGVASRIDLSSSKEIITGSGVDTTLVTGRVYDQFNNPVLEGTPAYWELGYSGNLLQNNNIIDTASVVGSDGVVTTTYQSGIETNATSISLLVGEQKESLNISKQVINYSLSLSKSQFNPGEQGVATVTLSVLPERSIDVSWNNTHGSISGSSTIGSVTLQAPFFVSDQPSSTGSIIVNIAGIRKEANYNVNLPNQEGSIRFEHAAIAAGTNDVYTVESLSGSLSQAVIRSTTATVYGTPNETVTLSAGGLYSQNHEPQAVFAMSGIDANADGASIVIDSLSGIEATLSGDVSWDETESYIQPGSSLSFNGGYLLSPQNNVLDYDTDYYANIRFNSRELQAGAILLQKGNGEQNGYALSLVNINGATHLQASIATTDGNIKVVSDTPLTENSWYLAGLQLKKGMLTLGLNQERTSIPVNGNPINSGFAAGLRIGDGFIGWIDDIKIGQIDEPRGGLLTIEGETEKEITFDNNGQANITITSGSDSLSNLGSRVGFSIVTAEPSTAMRTEKELRYQTALNRLTLLDNPFTAAYAQTVQNANEQEGGIAVVDGQALAEAIEMLKKAGEPALKAIKTATQFLFEMTSISDIWQLTKAVYLWANNRFDEVDKIELAFAGIGLTLTITTVAISVGTAGAGAPGSFVALASVRGALRVLKNTLKEVFQREPQLILQIGGTVARWSFNLVGNILNGREGRALAIKQLTYFKDVFIELITNGSLAAWNMLKSVGKSINGINTFIQFRRLKSAPCITYHSPVLNDFWVRFTPINASLFSTADAARICGPDATIRIENLAETLSLNEGQRLQLMSVANRIYRVDNDFIGPIRVSEESIDKLAKMVKNNQGNNVQAFLDNMLAPNKVNTMRGFTFENMNQPFNTLNNSGDTVFDELIDAMDNLPSDDPDAYLKAYNQLATANASNIRGIYGEAATFKRLKQEPLSPESGLRANADELVIGQNVNYEIDGKPFNNVQGVDIESVLEPEELVSRSLKAETSSGRPLLVEVKNYTSNYPNKALKKQTKKHFEANIIEQVDRSINPNEWLSGKPHLHYEWMGEGFVNTNGSIKTRLFESRKKTVIEICEKQIKLPPLSRVIPAFDCLTDITFNVVTDLIVPLTAKAN